MTESSEDTFGPVFVSLSLREAKRAEAALTALDIDYDVSVEPIGRTLFGLKRNGVVMSVAVGDIGRAADALRAAGLDAGVVDTAASESDGP